MLKKIILWSLGIISFLTLVVVYGHYAEVQQAKINEEERVRLSSEIASCIAPLLSEQAKMKFAQEELNMGINEYATNQAEEGYHNVLYLAGNQRQANREIMFAVWFNSCSKPLNYTDYTYIVEGKLIESLREDPTFQKILAKLKPIRNHERLVFQSKHLAFEENLQAERQKKDAWMYKDSPNNNVTVPDATASTRTLEPSINPETLPHND